MCDFTALCCVLNLVPQNTPKHAILRAKIQDLFPLPSVVICSSHRHCWLFFSCCNKRKKHVTLHLWRWTAENCLEWITPE